MPDPCVVDAYEPVANRLKKRRVVEPDRVVPEVVVPRGVVPAVVVARVVVPVTVADTTVDEPATLKQH